jgi:putrescine aminotransferase
VAAAASIANLEILQGEKIVEQVERETGPYLASRWAELSEHPLVGEARTAGFLGAIELVKDKRKREFFEPRGAVGALCRDICFENGLVMRAVEDTMIVSPPLVMTRAEIDELLELAKRSLDETMKALAESRSD